MPPSGRGWNNLIQNWQPENLSAVNELLCDMKPLSRRWKVIAEYLEQARQALKRCRKPAAGPGFSGWRNFSRNKPPFDC